MAPQKNRSLCSRLHAFIFRRRLALQAGLDTLRNENAALKAEAESLQHLRVTNSKLANNLNRMMFEEAKHAGAYDKKLPSGLVSMH